MEYGWLIVRFTLLAFLIVISASMTANVVNGYEYHFENDGSIRLHYDDNKSERFTPRFLVLHKTQNPKLAMRLGELGKLNYNVATWQGGSGGEGIAASVDTEVIAGDGHDEGILKGDSQKRTADYFLSAPSDEWIANGVIESQHFDKWVFPKKGYGQLVVEIHRTESGLPLLIPRFTASKSGYYSIGYAGAPSIDLADVEDAWQPLVWQGRRFPERSYLTLAYRSTLPAPMVTRAGVTTSVIVDPEDIPFNPLPVQANSKFGIAIRNENGFAQPLVFSPVLGGADSKMEIGSTHTIQMRLFCHPGDTKENYERIARDIYDFHDFRTNVIGSLNKTLENIVAYGLSEYSQFNEELRGCSYATDVPGAVKNVSSLHPLSVAMVTDNPAIYERRAKPIIEYMLSREKFLFAVSPDVKIQNPSWRLKGPCAPASELAELHAISQGKNPYLLDLAADLANKRRVLNLETPIPAGRWDNVHIVAAASRDESMLKLAVEKADSYLNKEWKNGPEDFNNQVASFWDQLVPKFPELLNLYETTGEKRFLEAAHEAARLYAQFVWMCPRIPDEKLLVNEGGKAPHYWYLRSKGHPQMSAPEETVESWRLSEIGLTPEGPQTSTGHRAVFIATHAPWMMRIGHLTQDQFLKDIARSAIIGRYQNFPGYHMNTGRTTVYEKQEYPLRDHHYLGYNSFHYNHIWPHAALLIDYLISESFAKSEGAIDFPSRFAEGYAYLKNKVYGDRPGTFYTEEGVWPWMPPGLLNIDNPELNYIAGRKDDTLFIALSNQSFEAERSTVQLASSCAQVTNDTTVRMWKNNVTTDEPAIVNDAITVDIPAQGIVALAIDGVEMPERSISLLSRSEPKGDDKLNKMVQLPFAEKTTGYLIDLFGQRSAYIYLQATFETVESATISYKFNEEDDWSSVYDDSYPYEYSIELPDNVDGLKFRIETRSPDGELTRSSTATLGVNRRSD